MKQATGTVTATSNAKSQCVINVTGLNFIPRIVIEYALSPSTAWWTMVGFAIIDENGVAQKNVSMGASGSGSFTVTPGGFSWTVSGWTEGTQTTYRWYAIDAGIDFID